MTTERNDEGALEWTGERYVPEISGDIRLEHVHRYVLARELAKGKRVLDIACGEGYGSALLAEVALRVTGVDIVPGVVAHAARRYQRNNLRFVAGSCAAFPLADRSVDLVVSFETLEHLVEHDEMMQDVKRVLRPGGVLVISSPDRREYSDVLGNRNAFHVRELDYDEFASLLGGHFEHVEIVGQRVRAGSVVGPVDATGRTRYVSFHGTDLTEGRREGLRDPIYLIAVATDADMPAVPAGVFDGGEFIWSADHTQAVGSLQAQFGEAKALLEGRSNALSAEVDRHITTIKALSVDVGRFDERSRRLEQQIGEVRRHHDVQIGSTESLAAENQALRRRAEEADAELARYRESSQAAWTVRESEVEARAAQRLARIAQIDGALETSRARESELSSRLTILENSRSWKLTSPMRGGRRWIAAAPPMARRLTSDVARAAYRQLPVSVDRKIRIKSALFRRAPALFRHTVAFRAWQDLERVPLDASPAESPSAPVQTREPEPDSVMPSSWQYGTIPTEWDRASPETSLMPPTYPEMPAAAPEPAPVPLSVTPVPLTTAAAVDTRIKAIAFYLPQFHPIPENDQWWGAGFTEWRNVVQATPQFPGHYQPHLPAELGFYDLRVVDVQRRQIELAKAYGLHGFCYYHYWFGGTRLLQRPLQQLLANPDLDFPFCVCWANENWTRRWDGLDEEVLIAQRHSPEDDLAFIRDLEPALRDRRYIRVDGRPLLIVYRPELLPNASETAQRWRQYCREAGLGDPFLVSTHAFEIRDPNDFGFDAAIQFAPNNMNAPALSGSDLPGLTPGFKGRVFDYSYLVEYSRQYRPRAGYTLFRTVVPMWDNESRRPGRGTSFVNSTPALYGEWLENACQHTVNEIADEEQALVFVNAWNEWAEGAHLEPDARHGYGYLQATADALQKFPRPRSRPSIVVVSHDAHFHGAQRLALTLTLTLAESLGYDVNVLLCGDGQLKSEFAKAAHVHEFFSPTATLEVQERIVRDLYDRGARVALCNTSCVGPTVRLLKKAGFTVVSLIHELPGLIGDFGLADSIAAIARDADCVVFAAGIVRDRFIELTGLPYERAVVRPQGLLAGNRFEGRREEARRELRERLGLKAQTRIVLAVGYGDRRKGIDLFVEVGLAVSNQLDDVVFVWVGHHEVNAFAQAYALVVRAGAEARFIFPGLVEDADVFFAGSDAYLLTSREDPFPLVVLDALCAELPTIGFNDAGGFVELLQRDCGILVPYLDTTAMAAALVRVLDPSDETHRITAAGKAIIDEEFSFLDYGRDLVQLARGSRPRISVIVPNYNYARYLPSRLRSILTQTCAPDEILFLDDCSSDRSVEVAARLLGGTSIPVRIIRNEKNQGVYRQWLRGLREATGELIWIAEADDDCAPTLLETLLPSFANSDVVLAYCQSKQIDGTGREIAPDYLAWTEDVNPTKWRHPYVRHGIEEIRDSLVVKNTIPNVSAVLMRKPNLAEIESQLMTMRNAGDWLLYVHLLERGDLAYFPEAVNYHRRHSASVTIGHGGLNLMQETLLVQRHVLDRHSISPEVDRRREDHLQWTYEFLGLHGGSPSSYKDHQALTSLAVLAG